MCREDDPRFSRTINQAKHFALGQMLFEAVGIGGLLMLGGIIGGIGSLLSCIGASVVACSCTLDFDLAFKLHWILSAAGLLFLAVHIPVFFVIFAEQSDNPENHASSGAMAAFVILEIVIIFIQFCVRAAAIILARRAQAEASSGSGFVKHTGSGSNAHGAGSGIGAGATDTYHGSGGGDGGTLDL